MTIKLGFGDTETTGFDASEGHRIVEVCLLTYDFHTRKLEHGYIQRIDPDRNIPAAASAVHGITYEMLTGCPKWEDVAGRVAAQLNSWRVGVFHNAGFDVPFFGHELLRVGQPLPGFQAFCTMENGRWATPDGKSPKLAELCFALGVEFDPGKAHGAEYDTTKLAECFFAGLDRGFYKVPALAGASA